MSNPASGTAPSNVDYEYSLGEEIANGITHGIGILLGVAGLVILVAFAALYGDAWHITACSIFGATLIMMYSASTLYHSIQNPRIKRALRVFDHVSIYFLIAGTYTPFALVNLREDWGWVLFGVIWGLAIIGSVFKLFFTGRFDLVSTAAYVLMGWAALFAIRPMIDNVEFGGMALIVAGGLAYTLGVVFYVWERLPYNHAIWHLFVLAGSIFHYFAVLFYVIPGSTI